MDSLKLRMAFRGPEPVDFEVPTGLVWLERPPQRAALYTPDEIDPTHRYPLLTVLHGAGRQDEALMRAYRFEAQQRQAFVLVARSYHFTWDLIAFASQSGIGADGEPAPMRPDLDFLEYAYDLIYRRYPIDPGRQGLIGYSDGASYALSVALSNPQHFCAVAAWAAGFLALEAEVGAPGTPRPAVFLEYGTHDEIFPFEQVAKPMKRQLEQLGCHVTFRIDEGGRHWPSGDFQAEALDWFFSEPWQPRS
jgi:phospholipase/carboxylesterase